MSTFSLQLVFVRMVIRIMLMVPLYAIASLISLFSLGAAFVIDAIRDVYEVGPYVFNSNNLSGQVHPANVLVLFGLARLPCL